MKDKKGDLSRENAEKFPVFFQEEYIIKKLRTLLTVINITDIIN